ncbi:MAG TPA: hypothetical protein VF230_05665 [Acidimicrobiales bacterium]
MRRLEDEGFPAEVVRVRPRNLSPLDTALVDPPRRPRRNRAVAFGGLVGVALVASRGPTVATTAAAIVASVVAGLLFLMADGAYLRAFARRVDRAGALVRAERFDVLCSRRADEANHLLATWWHPDAPPAAPQEQPSAPEPRRLARVA